MLERLRLTPNVIKDLSAGVELDYACAEFMDFTRVGILLNQCMVLRPNAKLGNIRTWFNDKEGFNPSTNPKHALEIQRTYNLAVYPKPGGGWCACTREAMIKILMDCYTDNDSVTAFTEMTVGVGDTIEVAICKGFLLHAIQG